MTETDRGLSKTPTGIEGLDAITGGGLPTGRPTLVAGNAGSGKTLLGIQFLVEGARRYGESGVFLAFEERLEDLAQNVVSLGYDLKAMIDDGRLYVDSVDLNATAMQESGDYDLEALFIRLGYAIDAVGAKRVVLDTLDVLFVGIPDKALLRFEIQRLFRWLKARGVTAVVTGERGYEPGLTRQGLEEFVSDCVIVLDHRLEENISSRRLRVVKYRGSAHGTNEYPFLIDEQGLTLVPITSLRLEHEASTERIGTGVPALDEMFGGKGYFRGSSVLVSGSAGTGKSSLAAHLVNAACGRGERALYFAFEESPSQIERNMGSIGLDLARWRREGSLEISAVRPTSTGLEAHLTAMTVAIRRHAPDVVIIDPVNSFVGSVNSLEVKWMLMRLIDFMKARKITVMCNELSHGGAPLERTDVGISSLMDTWMVLRNHEGEGERTQSLTVVKSRGMAHSLQMRRFFITDRGVRLGDPWRGDPSV